MKQNIKVTRDLKQSWEDVEAHKIAFGHLPDESCRSGHPLECNRADQPITCDYHLSESCNGTLKGRKGTKHTVYAKPSDYPERPLTKWACIECEMLFDND